MPTLKTLKQFKDAGAIVSKEPVKRHIEWKAADPESDDVISYDADVFIVKPASGVIFDVFKDESKEQVAALISKAVLLENDKGKLELISFDDAYQLDGPLRNALWEEIQKVGGTARKNLTPLTNSSANSSPAGLAETP